MKALLSIVALVLPQVLRRWLLNQLPGYSIHPTATIGRSIVRVKRLSMGARSRIGSLTMVKGLDELRLDEGARLGNLNWITGFPSSRRDYFMRDPDRCPRLHIGADASITHRHLIDCTDSVSIGAFTTFAGWGSQILTHSIDITENAQRSAPVTIGERCFVGTRVVLLRGTALPDKSVLAAGSVLTTLESEAGCLYGGVPARNLKQLNIDSQYLTRTDGVVH